jgi:hypothetical protein
MLDNMDIKILTILQEDSTLPVAEIGKKVGLSTTPCWRRGTRSTPAAASPPWRGFRWISDTQTP